MLRYFHGSRASFRFRRWLPGRVEKNIPFRYQYRLSTLGQFTITTFEVKMKRKEKKKKKKRVKESFGKLY